MSSLPWVEIPVPFPGRDYLLQGEEGDPCWALQTFQGHPELPPSEIPALLQGKSAGFVLPALAVVGAGTGYSLLPANRN